MKGINICELEMFMGAHWIRKDMFYFSKFSGSTNYCIEIHGTSLKLVAFLMLIPNGIAK